MPVFRSPQEIDFSLDTVPAVPRPKRVLLTTPSFFDVLYVINPHMEGHIGTVDAQRARAQWLALKNAYQSVGILPSVLEGAADLPDMVFCANQTLPFFLPHTRRRGAVLSRMHTPQRSGEVAYYQRFFEEEGYEIVAPPPGVARSFEGMGDAIWHPERALLWGGHGYRTDADAYPYIAERLGIPIVLLELKDPDFYHLDTCFCALDPATVLIFTDAFDSNGLASIRTLFSRVIEAPEDEARHLFACNAHSPDGRHVFIQRGCRVTNRRLVDAGYEPVELDTDEFLKSGGSVFCMKQMFW